MKIFTLVFFYCFIIIFTSNGQSLSHKNLIFLNLDDCVNCQNNLYLFFKDHEDEAIPLIIQKKYQEDSIDIINMFNLEFYNFSIIFSDSLFQAYVSNDKKSKIIYLNENLEMIHSQNLQDYKSLAKETKPTSSLCLEAANDYPYYKFFYPHYIVQYRMSLGKFLVHPLNGNSVIPLIWDNTWLEEGYKSYIGKDYKEYYDQMLEISKFSPGAKGSILGLDIKNNTASILYDVGMPSIDSTLNAVRISKKFLLREMDLTTSKFLKSYPVMDDSLRSLNYYISLGAVYKDQDFLYLSVKNQSNINYNTIAKFKLEKNSYYHFSGFIQDSLPPHYITYNLNQFFHQQFFNGPYTILQQSNYILDYSNNLKYSLPIDSNDLVTLSMMKDLLNNQRIPDSIQFYSVVDLAIRQDGFDVLYRLPTQGLKIAQFKKGQFHPYNSINLSINGVEFRLHPSKPKVLFFQVGNKCLMEESY